MLLRTDCGLAGRPVQRSVGDWYDPDKHRGAGVSL
jgi:hypothetical protein